MCLAQGSPSPGIGAKDETVGCAQGCWLSWGWADSQDVLGVFAGLGEEGSTSAHTVEP